MFRVFEEEKGQIGWNRESTGVGDAFIKVIGEGAMRAQGTMQTIIKYQIFTLREMGTIAGF